MLKLLEKRRGVSVEDEETFSRMPKLYRTRVQIDKAEINNNVEYIQNLTALF